MRIGKGLEEERVGDAEYGGVGADTDGERKDDDECEAGAFGQYAQAVAEIL
jgi:hypothetical protein